MACTFAHQPAESSPKSRRSMLPGGFIPEPGPSVAAVLVLSRHSPRLPGVQLRLVEARRGVALNAVDESLERADANPVVAEAGRDAGVGQLVPLVERRTREHAHGELAASLELRVDRELRAAA